MKIFVTGGAGFIGSALIRHLVRNTDHTVLNVDRLTYAANLASLKAVDRYPRYAFEHTDICDSARMDDILAHFRPDAIMHLAAESHVDRSIDGPEDFIQTNILGTFRLLNAALRYYRGAEAGARDRFRFHHISTDEVFGELGAQDPAFCETTPYAPRSPYSASKASADHLVRAWGHTYGLPILITNCTNNYGPCHFPEKLIPLIILKALCGEKLPVYGTGENIRDWLYVEDHAEALTAVIERGRIGETYAIGGLAERSNLTVVQTICDILDELAPPLPDVAARQELIHFVGDRPGHDFRYAMDIRKITRELGWTPRHSFETGLRETVQWYLDNRDWWEPLQKTYDGERLGRAMVAS